MSCGSVIPIVVLWLLTTAWALANSPYEPAQALDRIIVMRKLGAAQLRVTTGAFRPGDTLLKTFNTMEGLQVVRLRPGSGVQEALKYYSALPDVLYAEPDYVRMLALMPDDPRVANGQSWGLHNTGQNGGLVDADIDAPEAWDIMTGAPNVTVAVLDTGIRSTHQDLAANMWTSPLDRSHGWNAVNGTNVCEDDEGHGTLVAGIIGAVGNNGKGMSGIAWNVRLMSAKCFDANRQGTDSQILECIEFARTNGARIINASWGGYGFSQSLSNALVSARDRGIVFVCSAGNDGRDIDANLYYPACYEIDNVISVGASTRSDALAKISNFGATNVDLFAPGDQIYSTFYVSDSFYLGPLAGTSLAAPYVAGALALVMERYPGETPAQSIARLLRGAEKVSAFENRCITGARLSVRNALSPPIHLTISSRQPGEIELLVEAGSPGRPIVLQSSTDSATWSPVLTGIADASGRLVVRTNTPGQSVLYRVQSTP